MKWCVFLVAKDIADDMGCFDGIGYIDNNIAELLDGTESCGTVVALEELSCEYSNVIVAVKDTVTRSEIIKQIEETTPFRLVSLVSPQAKVSPSSQIMNGCIVEPMAIVYPGSVISSDCILSAGSIVKLGSMCCECVNLGCNSVVAEKTIVPAGTIVDDGVVFEKSNVEVGDLFL